MPFENDVLKQLIAKLDPKNIREREQGKAVLSYIEGWHVIAEANRIFGFDGWTRETIEMRMVAEGERKIGRDQKQGWGVSYIARVKVIAQGVSREGAGSGHGIDIDLGKAHESAIKEAETDAMKRAFMTFGNPFGLALYDKEWTNVAVDQPEPEAPRGAPDQMELKSATAALMTAAFKGMKALEIFWKSLPAEYREEKSLKDNLPGLKKIAADADAKKE